MLTFTRCLLAASLVFPAAAFGETLKLRTKKDLEASVVGLERDELVLKDGRRIPRDKVEEIIFTGTERRAKKTRKVSPEDRARAKKLFAEAAAFGKKFPGMDGLVLRDHGEYVLREDGTWLFRYRFVGQVLKESLKHQWGTVIESFEEGRSRADIVEARTYTRDGGVYPLERDKITVTQPQGGALYFTPYKLMNYSLPQVEAGAIIEYVTERETHNPFRPDFFFPSWSFQGRQPTKSSRLSITVPRKRKLHYHAKSFTGPFRKGRKPKKSSVKEGRAYVWELEDVPAIISEPAMNQPGDFAPTVKAGVFKDWGRIFKWLKKMYKERSVAGSELAKFTRELVKGARTEDEKVARIYHYLQKRIRYVAVKMGTASMWGGYDANLTWKRQYGCCIDKALLFTAMLNTAGIESTPLIVDTNYAADHIFEIPDIWFQHAISKVRVGGRDIVLDSTGYDYRYPYFGDANHGVQALNIFAEKIERVDTPPPADNSSRYLYKIGIEPDGRTRVRFSTEYTGPKEARLRGYYKRQKEAELKKMFQGWINGVSPGGRLLDYALHNLDDVSKPFWFSLDYELPDYPIRAGDLAIVKLPELKEKLRFGEAALEERTYDIEHRSSMRYLIRYDISLPETYRTEHLPEALSLKNPHGAFTAGCELDGRRLVCDMELRRESRVIPSKDYEKYRRFLRKIGRYAENRLFFKDTTAKGGAR